VLLARSINYPNISLTAIQDQLGRRLSARPHRRQQPAAGNRRRVERLCCASRSYLALISLGYVVGRSTRTSCSPWTRDSGIGGADRRCLLWIDHAVAEHTKGRTVLKFLAPGETWAETGRWKREQRLIKIKRAADPLSTIRSNRPVVAWHQKAAVEIRW
jgi:hypothetical protein